MRPSFDAALIGDLRQRVIAHNQAHPEQPTRLAKLKDVYERGYRRSNPGSRAMAKVDSYLNDLAKAGPSMQLELPASVADHRKLQAENAGYRALTSEAIPDQRHAAIGAVARDVGSYAAGAALVAHLGRGKKNGFAERTAGRAGAFAGEVTAGTGAWLGGMAAQGARKAVGKIVPGVKPASEKNMAMMRRGAAKLGGDIGRKVAGGAARTASNVVHGALHVAGDTSTQTDFIASQRPHYTGKYMKGGMFRKPMPFPAARAKAFKTVERMDRNFKRGRKAAVFGLLAAGAGSLINNSIKGSVVDPENIGHGIDSFSYRQVQKAILGDRQLGLAKQAMTQALAKGGNPGGSVESLQGWLEQGGGELGALRKYNLPSMRILTGAAAAIGALGGAGLGLAAHQVTKPAETGEHGWDSSEHPRDGHGRFEDKAGRGARFAQVGALLGGTAAGIAAWRAMRGHNSRLFNSKLFAIRSQFNGAISQAQEAAKGDDRAWIGAAKDLYQNRTKRAEELINTHPEFEEHRTRVRSLETLGPSDPTTVQQQLGDAYRQQIASSMAGSGDVELPDAKGDWKTHGGHDADQRINPDRPNLLQIHQDRVKSFLAGASRVDFHRATEKMPDAIRTRLRGLYDRMETDVASVPENLSGHAAKVDAATNDLRTAEDGLKQANAAKEEADVNLSTLTDADEETKAAHEKAVNKAKNAVNAATKKHAAASKALEDLKANPTGVINPFAIPPKPLAPPTPEQIKLQVDTMRAGAKAKADKMVVAEQTALQDREIKTLYDQMQLHEAALAADHWRTGMPGGTSAIGRRVTELKAVEDEAHRKLVNAQVTHAMALADKPDLDRITSTTTRSGFRQRPDDMTPERYRDLRHRSPELRLAHGEVDDAAAAHAKARAERVTASNAMRAALDEHENRPARQPIFSEETKQHLREGLRDATGPLKEFLQTPTGAKFRAFVEHAYGTTKNAAAASVRGVKHGINASILKLFFVPGDNGQPEFSPRKALMAISLLEAGHVAATEDFRTMKDRWFGDEDDKKKASSRSTRMQRDHDQDPITGAGHFAVSVPDPKNSKERIVLWGERWDHEDQKPKPIYAGTKLSVLRQRMEEIKKQAQNRQSGGGASANSSAGIGTLKFDNDEHKKQVEAALTELRNKGQVETVKSWEPGGPTFKARAEGHEDAALGQKTVSPVLEQLRKSLKINSPTTLENGNYHNALAGLFSENAGGVLKPSRIYQILTGFNPASGEKGKDRIFDGNADFGSKDGGDVADALKGEIDRVMSGSGTRPKDDAQRNNLVRAAAVVAKVKGLDAETMKPIYAAINGGQTAAGQQPPRPERPAAGPQPSPGPQPAPEPAPAAAAAPRQDVMRAPIDPEEPISHEDRKTQRFSDSRAMETAKNLATTRLASKLHLDEFGRGALPAVMTGIARKLVADPSYGRLDEDTAVQVVADTLDEVASYQPHILSAMWAADHPTTFATNSRAFMQVLGQNAELAAVGQRTDDKVGKVADLADFEALAKLSLSPGKVLSEGAELGTRTVTDLSRNDNADGSAAPSGGTKAPAGFGAGAAAGGAAAAAAPPAPQGQSALNPVRLGTEMGSNLGFEGVTAAIGAGVKALLPETRFVAPVAEAVGNTVLGGPVSDAAAAAGGALGGAAQSAATGKPAEGYNPPAYHSTGEAIAEGVGGMVGGLAGNAIGAGAGGIAGSIAGGTLGGWAGEKLARGVYDFFAGYDSPSASAAQQRFGYTPKTPAGYARPASQAEMQAAS